MVKLIEKKPRIKYSSSDDLKTKILKIRGIDEDSIMDFLAPDESLESDFSLIRNISRATKTILEAVDNDKNILISGDPDADGVTSLAVMYNRLKELIVDDYQLDYIYSQRDMGHGINGQLTHKDSYSDSFNELVDTNIEKIKDADLLIVVDSSSNDIDGVNKAKELNPNLEVIILDHHQFNDEQTEKDMDKLAIVVNPQHSKDMSINKSLSGAGVVYKVCCAIDNQLNDNGFSLQYLDLVAVGLVGDMMDVRQLENRYYIAQGLQNVNNIGLNRILKGAKVNMYKYNSTDIGFSVAPLINASARMGQIELAYQILLAETDKEAKALRLKMNKLNMERQKLQSEFTEKYASQINLDDKIILIIDNESNKGFNGLVAQNIAQKYHRPCFIVRDYNGMCMGSGRSYGNFDTQAFLAETGYVEAEGHKQSHGIEFPSDMIDDLKQYIEDNMPDNLESELTYYYDIELDSNNIWNDFADIESLNYITGTGFPQIVVRMNNQMISSRNVIGKTSETVKFEADNELVFIKFKVNEFWNEDIDLFDTVTVVGTPLINEFYNFGLKEMVRTPQIIIKHIEKD